MLHRAAGRLGALWPRGGAWRRFQYRRAKRIARRHGFAVYKPQLIWLADEAFLSAQAEATRRGAKGIPADRCYMLLEAARLTRNVEGHFAECGVRNGKSSLFLLTGAGEDSAKRLHAFDSFAGLSRPGAADRAAGGDMGWASGELAVAEDVVRRNLSDFSDRVRLHKGWIPERFPDVEEERFSLVHVDVDLHEPTRAAVAFFYPRVNAGGVIICDDYGSARCPGAKKAIDEFFADKPERVIALPTGQSLVIKA